MSDFFKQLLPAIFVFSAYSGCVNAETIDIGGVSYDVTPLVAKHFPPLIQNIEAAQGSYLAWTETKCTKLERERDAAFPNGSPHHAMHDTAEALLMNPQQENLSDSEWRQNLQACADWAYYLKNINGFHEVANQMAAMPKAIVALANEIAQEPEKFTIADSKALEGDNTHINFEDLSFPVKCETGLFSYSSTAAFLRKHFETYSLQDIHNFSQQIREKATTGVDCLLSMFFPGNRQTGEDCIENAFNFLLEKNYDCDTYVNAYFVSEKVLFPLLEALRAIQSEALAAQKAAEQAQN